MNFANQTLNDYALAFPAAGEWQLRFDSHYAGYDESFEGQVSGAVTAVSSENGRNVAKISIAPYSAIIYSQ